MRIYSIFDKKAKVFNGLYFAENDVFIQRQFEMVVNDVSQKNNMWRDYASDYDLYLIGDFNLTTGELLTDRSLVVSLLSLKKEIE